MCAALSPADALELQDAVAEPAGTGPQRRTVVRLPDEDVQAGADIATRRPEGRNQCRQAHVIAGAVATGAQPANTTAISIMTISGYRHMGNPKVHLPG